MICSRFEAKDVVRQMKRADLTPAIGEQFVSPNGALNDLIDIVRRLAFSVDFFVFPVGELRGNEAGMTREQPELIDCRADGGADLGANNRGGKWLGMHLPSPVQRMADVLPGAVEAGYFARYLKGMHLSSLPEAVTGTQGLATELAS